MSDEMYVIVKVLLAILTVLSILQVIFPEQAWYIEKGIWFKNSEPGDLAIILTRIGGIVLTVLFGFIWFIGLWT